jgi:hypothetical protein
MNQLALLDRMDEFFALGLGLHGIPTKSPDGSYSRSGPDAVTQSKDGQVLRLHSCRALSP